MKIKSFWRLFLCVCLLGMTACVDAPYVKENLPVSQFHSLELENLFVGTFEASEQYSVTIEIPKKMMDLVETKVEEGCVSITLNTEGMSQGDIRYLEFNPPRVNIQAPSFQKIALSNACHLDVKGNFEMEKAKMKVSGASSMKLETLKAGQLKFDLSGASSMEMVKMEVGHLDLDLSGASALTCGSAKVEEARLDLSGASSLDWIGFVNVGKLEATGASEIDWTPLYDKKGERMSVDASGVSNIRADHVRFHQVDVKTSGLSVVRLGGQVFK